MIEKIAKMLGVELYEEFKIKPTKKGEIMGVKPCEKIFRFDTELVYKGYDDGWYFLRKIRRKTNESRRIIGAIHKRRKGCFNRRIHN